MVTIKQIQQQLNKLGYGILQEDGINGKNTIDAVIRFQKDNCLTADGIVGAKTQALLFPKIIAPPKSKILTIPQVLAIYGEAGDIRNHVSVTSPYKMSVAWDKKISITSFTCHKKIQTKLQNVLEELLWHYGYEEIKRLGIDLYGGCFNHRPMRGTEKKYTAAIKAKNWALAATFLSKHSWAIALDLDPERNALKTKWSGAQFSKPEYKAMIDIFYKHGFLNYGVERNNDAMHMEISGNVSYL